MKKLLLVAILTTILSVKHSNAQRGFFPTDWSQHGQNNFQFLRTEDMGNGNFADVYRYLPTGVELRATGYCQQITPPIAPPPVTPPVVVTPPVAPAPQIIVVQVPTPAPVQERQRMTPFEKAAVSMMAINTGANVAFGITDRVQQRNWFGFGSNCGQQYQVCNIPGQIPPAQPPGNQNCYWYTYPDGSRQWLCPTNGQVGLPGTIPGTTGTGNGQTGLPGLRSTMGMGLSIIQ